MLVVKAVLFFYVLQCVGVILSYMESQTLLEHFHTSVIALRGEVVPF